MGILGSASTVASLNVFSNFDTIQLGVFGLIGFAFSLYMFALFEQIMENEKKKDPTRTNYNENQEKFRRIPQTQCCQIHQENRKRCTVPISKSPRLKATSSSSKSSKPQQPASGSSLPASSLPVSSLPVSSLQVSSLPASSLPVSSLQAGPESAAR